MLPKLAKQLREIFNTDFDEKVRARSRGNSSSQSETNLQTFGEKFRENSSHRCARSCRAGARIFDEAMFPFFSYYFSSYVGASKKSSVPRSRYIIRGFFSQSVGLVNYTVVRSASARSSMDVERENEGSRFAETAFTGT